MENDQKGATGGDGKDTGDDKIMEQVAVFFRGFVIECARMDDPQMHLVPEDLGGRADELHEPLLKKVVLQFRTMWNKCPNKESELERFIDDVDLDSVQNVLFSVARNVLSIDVNWGKVVVFFYFAYRLIYKALTRNQREVIPKIVAWVSQVSKEQVSACIKQQGGWVNVVLKSVIGWNNVIILAAGILTGTLLYWKIAN